MAFLVEVKGPEQGRRFELQKDATTIGRREENEIPVPSTSVSGRHLVILREGARFKLKDLDSTNGTLLNGTPVREAMLSPGNLIAMGEVQFEFNDPAWAEITPETDEASKTTPTVNVKPAAQRGVPTSFESASPFGRRRDFSNIWMALIILAAMIAGGLAVFFFFSFFHS